jgi:hypothetical protein
LFFDDQFLLLFGCKRNFSDAVFRHQARKNFFYSQTIPLFKEEKEEDMEFRDIVKLYWEERRLFLLVVAVTVFMTLVWQVNQPVMYRASLLLNIGREGAKTTVDYTYDNFYRLQADERFADTVVRWLQSPRVVSDILTETGIRPEAASERELRSRIGAKRLSSQVVEASFVAGERSVLEKESEVIVKILNAYASGLNRNGTSEGWFVVVGSNPVILDARTASGTAIAFGLALGVFLAFWGIALKRYVNG